jgi:2-keto-4-pentenoate hydratase/2-oxohepta-3-ene-1,7-dioic acid hydratase in catechol pathway
MKLVNIREGCEDQLGVWTEQGIVDIRKAMQSYPDTEIPTDPMTVIEDAGRYIPALERYVVQLLQQHSAENQALYLLQENDVQYGPCVPHPSKIICVGLNYRKHAEETGSEIPKFPVLFNKFSNTLAGHGEEIPLPVRVTNEVDYEAELVIVIGKEAKYVNKQEALQYIFGYTCVNDLSARDLQMRTPQWLLGKTCDKFSPLGPWLVTSDEVGNPNELSIKSIVNGQIRQSSNTSDMIFHCDGIVCYISQHMTLYPGDIILTGTPEGVVLGLPPEERVYLKDGDVVTIQIEKVGSLTNRFVNEQV